jgi:hypothetical protein
MYAIGTDITTGDVMIRNYTNGTAIRIPADDIALVADLVRNEYPECEFCEGTRVDGYCTDCGHCKGKGRPADLATYMTDGIAAVVTLTREESL